MCFSEESEEERRKRLLAEEEERLRRLREADEEARRKREAEDEEARRRREADEEAARRRKEEEEEARRLRALEEEAERRRVRTLFHGKMGVAALLSFIRESEPMCVRVFLRAWVGPFPAPEGGDGAQAC